MLPVATDRGYRSLSVSMTVQFFEAYSVLSVVFYFRDCEGELETSPHSPGVRGLVTLPLE